MVDLRSNEDDRPYRGVSRAQYTPPGQREQYDYDDTMTTQAYYRERLRGLTEQRWFPLAAVTCGVIVFGSLIAFAYRQGADTTANSTTPLIQAENGSYKEKPQDPGGMDVPFQDAVVFDQIDKTKTADANSKVENLLPPPEQPVETASNTTPQPAQNATTATAPQQNAVEASPPSAPKETANPGVEAAADTDSVADKIAATEANLKNKAPETTTQTEAAVTETPAATTNTTTQTATVATATKAIPAKAAVKAETAKVATAKVTTMNDVVKSTTTTTAHTTPAKMNAVAPAAPTPTPVKTGGAAKVQLGAFKDEGAAKAAWASLQKQYAPHLNGVTPNYARADLGAKGVFYRVQGVGLSKDQATNICKAINASKPGACLIAQ